MIFSSDVAYDNLILKTFTNKLDILLPIQIDTDINEIILDFNLEKNLFYSKNVCSNSLNE